MTNAMIMKELTSLDPEGIEGYMLRECYERTIPEGVKRIVGVYPTIDKLWKPDRYETFTVNAARFVRDVLDAHYQGDKVLYSNRQTIGQFRMDTAEGKAVKLYPYHSGYHSCTGDALEILTILHLALTGVIPEYSILDTESYRLNAGKKPFVDENTFNEAIEIGPYKLKLRLFKNFSFEVRGLTPDQIGALKRVKELADRPL